MTDKKDLKKFLIFSPHPDDSDFGCGGTAAKLAEEGKDVVLCVVTDGSKGVHYSGLSTREIVPIREKEQKASARVLGIKKVVFLRAKDGEFENTRDLRKKIVKVIRHERPDVVLSLDPGNKTFDSFYRFHRDHRIVAETVFDAVYPEAGCDVFFPDLVRQGYKPHTIKQMWLMGTNNPDMFMDISSTLDKKIEALQQHKSQIPNMKSLAARIRERAKETGKKKKTKYAEEFRILSF